MKRIFFAVLFLATLISSAEASGRFRFRGRSRSYITTTTTEFTGDANTVCQQKATIMARNCRMWHMGGSFGGGSCEGVGTGNTPEGALSVCCYTGQRTCIGQAVFQGVNGIWYACKLFR
jgi:hypothetical protein